MLLAVSTIPALPVVALMAIGVVLSIIGSAIKMRGLVAFGLILLFLATAGMLVGAFAAYHGDETDPRPSKPASDPSF